MPSLLLRLGPAQAQPTPVTEVRFEHITVDQSLSRSDATCIACDASGFIWLGTSHGLNRHDGCQLRPYRLPTNPANGQAGNRLKVLSVTSAGQL